VSIGFESSLARASSADMLFLAFIKGLTACTSTVADRDKADSAMTVISSTSWMIPLRFSHAICKTSPVNLADSPVFGRKEDVLPLPSCCSTGSAI
jgi:hypothetical protein